MEQHLKNLPETLRGIQRLIANLEGSSPDIPAVLEWLEQEHRAREKKLFSRFLVRDVSRHGTPSDLYRMREIGYDLRGACTYQMDGHSLHVAAQYGKRSNVLALVEMGLSLNDRLYPKGDSALDEMLINGHIKLFKECLSIHQLQTSDPITDVDRVRFLSAAVSGKTRKEGNRDPDKRRATRFTLRNLGPFTQDHLDQALCEVAKSGWVETFDELVQAGASAGLPSTLFLKSGLGEGTVLMELLQHTSPANWDRVLQNYQNQPKLFFPAHDENKTPRPTIEHVLEDMPGSKANVYLELAKKPIEIMKKALRLEELNEKLERVEAVTRRPLRF